MKFTVIFDDDLGIVLKDIEDVHSLVDFMVAIFQRHNSNFEVKIKGEKK
uniref:Uncharacterized protein n=1 Tax=Dulem virus 157 TaxID=3145634 RepID=A0AAU8B4P9_9VIRU